MIPIQHTSITLETMAKYTILKVVQKLSLLINNNNFFKAIY